MSLKELTYFGYVELLVFDIDRYPNWLILVAVSIQKQSCFMLMMMSV